MPDRMPAQITIGGDIPETLLAAFCDEIGDAEASLDWDTPWHPVTKDEIVSALTEDGVLILKDTEASGGEFGELEPFLRTHGIPYDRHTSAKYEYDAELERFRPGVEGPPTHGTFLSNQDGAVLVHSDDVWEALERLDSGQMEIAKAALREAIGADIGPVPPLVFIAREEVRDGE